MLHAHPDIATNGEMGGPARKTNRENYRCSCGQPIGQCSFFAELFRRVQQRGLRFDLEHWTAIYALNERWYLHHRDLLNRIAMLGLRSNTMEVIREVLLAGWPARRRAIQRAHRATAAYAQAGMEILGRKVWLDAHKEAIRLRFLRRNPQLDLWVIYLVRDPRGVVSSLHRNKDYTWQRCARFWVRESKEADWVRRGIPGDRQMLLHYETLCAQPTQTIDDIARFLGLQPCGSYDFAVGGHHLLGNAMRLYPLAGIKNDERWRQEIPPEVLPVISRMVKPVARRYAYDV